MVRSHGYRAIVATDCSGKNYKYNAIKRGVGYRMKLEARTGRIFQVTTRYLPGGGVPGGKLTCNQAVAAARSQGYRKVRIHKCSGNRYTLYAKRGGVKYRLRMRASTGKIYKVTRR